MSGFYEPRMLIRSVVMDEIEEKLQSPLVRGHHEPIKLLERAELWIDPGIVGNVVAKVGHWERKIGGSQTVSTPSSTR